MGIEIKIRETFGTEMKELGYIQIKKVIFWSRSSADRMLVS